MSQNDLTRRELLELQDALQREILEIETYGNYIGQTEDPKLKQVLESIQKTHQNHYDQLVNQINPGNRGG